MKRALTLILVLAMILSMCIVGCTKKDDTATPADVKTAKPSKEETKEPLEEKGLVTPPGEFPVVNEPYEIDVFAARTPSTEDLTTNQFTTWYEEKTGVHLNIDQINEDEREEKVNIILASGDYPDMFLRAGLSRGQVMLYGSQGVFVPMQDYINDHMVELPKLLEEQPYIRAGITAPDGNIYALPRVEECYHCKNQQKMFVYTPWLEKLGIDSPQTTQEYKDMLIAFKEKDPNGNGKADEIPLMAATNGWNVYLHGFLMQPFEYCDGKFYKTEGGKIVGNANTEGWKNGLRYARDLYVNELLDPLSFTQDQAQLMQTCEDPEAVLVGSVPAGYYGCFVVNFGESERFLDYDAVAPLEGPDGRREAAVYPYSPAQHLLVTNKAKNPEVIARWADWFYTLDGTISVRDGAEGQGWHRAEEGMKSYTGEDAYYIKDEKVAKFSQMQNIGWMHTGPGYVSAYARESEAKEDREQVLIGQEYWLWKWTREMYEEHGRDEYNQVLWYNEEQAGTIAELKSTIDDYVKASYAKFVTGEWDIDADWDNYVEQLETMGYSEYLKAHDDALQMNLAALGK